MFYGLLIGLVVMGPLAAVGRDRRALVIRAVLEALAASGLTHKDAQFYMGMDKSQYSRSMDPHGDLQLSLYKLSSLPLAFQLEFLGRYAALVVRESAREIAEDVAMVRVR